MSGSRGLRDLMMTCNVEVVCEPVYSDSLKQRVLSGLGLAWLPIVLYGHRKPQSDEADSIFRHFAEMQGSQLAR